MERRPDGKTPAREDSPITAGLSGFAERFGRHLAGWVAAISKIDARENHSRITRQRLEAEYPTRR